MSSATAIKDVQERIKQNLEELEENIQNGKMYWSQCSLVLNDEQINNFIKVQHDEIMHHLQEIKHHVQQINYHEEILESITGNNNVNTKNFQISTPLKYWEKVAEDQNLVKDGSVVTRKPKKPIEEEHAVQVPKILVKNRVEQYEELEKCKRASSTIEPYIELHKVTQTSHPNRCEDSSCDKDNPCNCYYISRTRSETVQEHSNNKCDLEEDVKVCFSDGTISPTKCETSEDDIPGDYKEAKENIPLTTAYEKNDIESNAIYEGELELKPRIIEMHFKSSNEE